MLVDVNPDTGKNWTTKKMLADMICVNTPTWLNRKSSLHRIIMSYLSLIFESADNERIMSVFNLLDTKLNQACNPSRTEQLVLICKETANWRTFDARAAYVIWNSKKNHTRIALPAHITEKVLFDTSREALKSLASIKGAHVKRLLQWKKRMEKDYATTSTDDIDDYAGDLIRPDTDDESELEDDPVVEGNEKEQVDVRQDVETVEPMEVDKGVEDDKSEEENDALFGDFESLVKRPKMKVAVKKGDPGKRYRSGLLKSPPAISDESDESEEDLAVSKLLVMEENSSLSSDGDAGRPCTSASANQTTVTSDSPESPAQSLVDQEAAASSSKKDGTSEDDGVATSVATSADDDIIHLSITASSTESAPQQFQNLPFDDVVIGMWVIVKFKNDHYLGQVIETRESSRMTKVKCLSRPFGVRMKQPFERRKFWTHYKEQCLYVSPVIPRCLKDENEDMYIY